MTRAIAIPSGLAIQARKRPEDRDAAGHHPDDVVRGDRLGVDAATASPRVR